MYPLESMVAPRCDLLSYNLCSMHRITDLAALSAQSQQCELPLTLSKYCLSCLLMAMLYMPRTGRAQPPHALPHLPSLSQRKWLQCSRHSDLFLLPCLPALHDPTSPLPSSFPTIFLFSSSWSIFRPYPHSPKSVPQN